MTLLSVGLFVLRLVSLQHLSLMGVFWHYCARSITRVTSHTAASTHLLTHTVSASLNINLTCNSYMCVQCCVLRVYDGVSVNRVGFPFLIRHYRWVSTFHLKPSPYLGFRLWSLSFTVHVSLFIPHFSSLTVHPSSFIISRSSCTVNRESFIVDRSSLIIHLFPFIV